MDPSRNKSEQDPAPPSRSLWDAVLEKVRDAAAPRFEVERLLGYGGMAGIYLAREPRLGRHVAIKVMAPSLMMDPELVERFHQEARTIAQLHHPHIITIYDVGEAENLHYFVMAYVPGRTVGHVMSEMGGPLPLDVVRAWTYQVGSALDHAHGFGIVHRDVKPGNVLLDARGNALVTDFGIAKVADNEGLTRTGMLVGTPAYMSPEQCGTGEVGPASDQYSLGVLCYQMLTGEPPFSGSTMAVLHAHIRQPHQPVRTVRPDCPPELAEGVDRMLAKAPGERWPSIGRALVAMGTAPVGHGSPVRARLIDLAAPVAKVTVSSPRGVQRRPIPSDPVAPGETFVVEAVVTDPDGRVLSGRKVSWSSETTEVARILPDGRVVALAEGTARVWGECGGVQDALVFPVAGEPVGPVSAAPRDVPAGTRVRLAELVPMAPPLSVGPDSGWGSTHPRIARVTADGQLEALKPGATTITVFDRGRAVLADLTVTPAHGTDGPVPAGWASTPAAAREGAGGRSDPAVAPPTAEAAGDLAATAAASRADPSPASRRAVLAPVGIGVIVVALGVGWALFGSGRAGPAGAGLDAGSEAPAEAGVQGSDRAIDRPSASVVVGRDGGDDEALDATASGEVAVDVPASGAGNGPPSPGGAATPRTTVQGSADAASVRPPPAEGSVRVGALPAGGSATITVGDETFPLVLGQDLLLPPGTYTARVSADGYRPYQESLTVTAGEALDWRPELRPEVVAPAPPVSAPEPAPERPAGPSPEELRAAAVAGMRALAEAFAAAFEGRDMDRVLAYFADEPGAWAARWEPLVEDTRNARDLTASMTDLRDLEVHGDGQASATFSIRLEYRDFRNSVQNAVLHFRARAARDDSAWLFTELSEGAG